MVHQEKGKIDQKVSIKNVDGDISVQNICAENVFVVSKDYEKGDDALWESEELVLSIYDKAMIDKVIEDVEEVKENLPTIGKYITLFRSLPKIHKGLFVSAIQLFNRENKISDKFSDATGTSILDDESIKLLDSMEQEDGLRKSQYRGCGDDFKKIYNILRSGDLDRKVLQKLDRLLKGTSTHEEFLEKFESYWYKRLENHPYSIFISGFTTFNTERLKTEILSKLDNREKESVRIYAKGKSRIMFVRTVYQEIEKNLKICFKENNYYIGSAECAEFVQIKND